MSRAADGQDKNEFCLEKNGLPFSCLSLFLGKLVKPLILVYFLFKKFALYLPFGVL